MYQCSTVVQCEVMICIWDISLWYTRDVYMMPRRIENLTIITWERMTDRGMKLAKIKLIRFAPKVVANGRSLCTRQNELIPQYSRKTCLLLATWRWADSTIYAHGNRHQSNGYQRGIWKEIRVPLGLTSHIQARNSTVPSPSENSLKYSIDSSGEALGCTIHNLKEARSSIGRKLLDKNVSLSPCFIWDQTIRSITARDRSLIY